MIISSSHSPNILGDPKADQLVELVCKLKTFILVLTESTVQFVACVCRAIKVLQERRWPVEAVLHFAFQILGLAIHVDVDFKRATEELMVQDCFEELNRKWLRVSSKIPQVTNKTKKTTDNCRTSTRVTNTAELLSCCRLGSGASLRCHLCDIYFPAGVCDAVVRCSCMSERVCVCLR